VCREQNVLADRLASMSMEIDTALYSILRRGDTAVDGLRVVASAARISKKSVRGCICMYVLTPLLQTRGMQKDVNFNLCVCVGGGGKR
jgi:hypothetical protein